MKAMFQAYYQPTQAEFEALWRHALIVLDTNVLLYTYKTPKAGREALLALLAKLQERLWVPHHVGLEFQRNRLSVIGTEQKAIDSALNKSETTLQAVAASIVELDLDARDIGVGGKDLKVAIEIAQAKVSEAINKARDAQLGITHQDPIRDQLDVILSGRVGPPPASQAELDLIYAEGDVRYGRLVPPGFKDSNKAKDPDEACYVAGGLTYQRQYADLLLWAQTIAHVSRNECKHVIFVTSDNKEDWWLQKDGKTLGPLPELVSEMRRKGSVETFWMYRLPMFMEQAREHLNAEVSKAALAEVEEVAGRSDLERSIANELRDKGPRSATFSKIIEAQAELVVLASLRKRGIEARLSGNQFPDIVIGSGLTEYGIEIATLQRVEGSFNWPQAHMKILKGITAVRRGEMISFELVLLISEEEADHIRSSGPLRSQMDKKVSALSQLAKNFGITIGSIRAGISFEVLCTAGNSFWNGMISYESEVDQENPF